jgi:signal transduction histidine kinase
MRRMLRTLGWPGLRGRLLLIGTMGLAAGFAAGGLLLVLTLELSLRRAVDAGARRTAADVADLVDAGQLPQPLPVAGVQVVQVVDAQARVRAGSPGVDRLVPILQPEELRTVLRGGALAMDGARAHLNGELLVVGRAAGPTDDRMAVVVAAPLDEAAAGPRALGRALLVAYPVFVVALAALAWWVIGRVLRPVEALRLGAEEITHRDGAGRLPVPVGEDEIHRLAVTLNGMLDRLDDARQRQRAFVADAAHELRNPLAGIRAQLEVSQRHPDRTDWLALTDDVLADAERLSRLAEDLLLLARADDPNARPVRSPPRLVAMGALVAELAARYDGHRFPGRSDAVAVRVRAEEGPWVLADPGDLRRVVLNLLDNAVRYAASAVDLAVTQRAGELLLTVTDDGPGIAPRDRDRVFRRFARLEGAHLGGGGGSGLGLPIVAELLRLHGGTVVLTDSPGERGLRVEVRIPGARPP